MVIDTSAILAILQREPEQDRFLKAIEKSDSRRMSIANHVECSIVIESRYGDRGLHDLERLVSKAAIELVPVDGEQGRLARSAFGRFGKGRHRAGLNFGDCFAYAAAIALGESLLCKGNDFIHTDAPVLDCDDFNAPMRDHRN